MRKQDEGMREVKKKVSEKISEALKVQGISKKQFAGMMDVQPSSVTKWLKGNHNFTTSTIFDIEWVLQIQIINLQ
jgi:ribosome-binding protein aMBF1 (putative translation factor)